MTAATTPAQATSLLGDAWAAPLEEVLTGALQVQSERLLAVGADLAPVVGTIRAAAAGGKRVRAGLVLAGWAGAGGRSAPDHVVLRVAAALELFHLAALVHDDVMDRSDVRRGRPTVRRSFTEQHRRDGFTGVAAGYGDAVAILVGDLCLSWSDELFCAALADIDDPALVAPTRQVYDLMRSQVMAGQFLDILEQHRRGSDPEAVRRVTTYKSAK